MNLQQLRLDRGWSQEHLADLSGVSARTIQRIERGSSAGLDTLNSLAAAFGTDVGSLTAVDDSPRETVTQSDHADDGLARRLEHRRARRRKEFHLHLASFILIMPVLFLLNLQLTPQHIWAVWPLLGWGAGLVLHWIMVFRMPGFMDADWEEAQIGKRGDRGDSGA